MVEVLMFSEFIDKNLEKYKELLGDRKYLPILLKICNTIKKASASGRKVILAGNGASAAIASHCAVDFTKQAGIKAICFNESSLLTCFSNDYGYENWIVEALKNYADPGDVVILISSSGESRNVINAAKFAKENDIKVISFTGFSPKNTLRKIADISLWVNSDQYNIVECMHMIYLTMVIDYLTERKSKEDLLFSIEELPVTL